MSGFINIFVLFVYLGICFEFPRIIGLFSSLLYCFFWLIFAKRFLQVKSV